MLVKGSVSMYFEKLNNHQKQFLHSLGISSDKDMPSEFFEKIKSLNTDLSKEEQFCVSDYNKVYCYYTKLDMERLVGTDHDKYVNKSWIEAFSLLSRGEEISELYLNNPRYYENVDTKKVDMGLVEKDGNFYIFSKNGGGNNRLITLKLLAIMQKYRGEKLIAPLVRCRKVPSLETCQNIFYCEYPNGDYNTSGLEVKKSDLTSYDEFYDIVDGPIFTDNVVFQKIYGHDILNVVFKNTEYDNLTPRR